MGEEKKDSMAEDFVVILVLPDEAAVKEMKGLLNDIVNRLDQHQGLVEMEKPSEN
ncbi:MAG TPA: hypothetical protein VK791_05860 [bacterium]|jgi:hypothetical protein|nr:hypothetical protein [bacterium]